MYAKPIERDTEYSIDARLRNLPRILSPESPESTVEAAKNYKNFSGIDVNKGRNFCRFR